MRWGLQGVVQELKNGRMEERANKILRDSVAADLANIKLDTQLEYTGHMYTHTYRLYASVWKRKRKRGWGKERAPWIVEVKDHLAFYTSCSQSHTHIPVCAQVVNTVIRQAMNCKKQNVTGGVCVGWGVHVCVCDWGKWLERSKNVEGSELCKSLLCVLQLSVK